MQSQVDKKAVKGEAVLKCLAPEKEKDGRQERNMTQGEFDEEERNLEDLYEDTFDPNYETTRQRRKDYLCNLTEDDERMLQTL